MPDGVPSLGELTYHAQPEIGGGLPGTVIDNRETVRVLNEAANIRSQNDWNKYLMFQNNLKDAYKNIEDISALETATEDKQYLNKQMGEIFQDIASDPRAFFAGGAKYTQIQGKIAKLRSEATESKINNDYNIQNRKFLALNPELNTDDNKGIIDNYLKLPLGQRKAYTLNMPTLFNYPEYFKAAKESAGTAFSQPGVLDQTTGEIVGDETSGFISTGTRYDRNKFMNSWMAGLDVQQDKYGHSIKSYAQQQYDKLPPEQKKQFSSVEDYWRRAGEVAFGSDKDITDVTKVDVNEYPFKVAELGIKEAQLGLEARRTAAQERASAALAASRYASAALSNKKAKAVDQQFNPPQAFDEIFKGKMRSGYTSNGNYVNRVNSKDLTKEAHDVLGIDPVNKDGDYNIIPANIQYGGAAVDEKVVDKAYKNWLKSDDAKKLTTKMGKTPDKFDFIYSQGGTFDVEVEGKIAPKYKVVVDGLGREHNILQNPAEAGKITRSSRLQSWINERKQLGIKGDKLLNPDEGDEGMTEVDVNNDNQ